MLFGDIGLLLYLVQKTPNPFKQQMPYKNGNYHAKLEINITNLQNN